MMIAIRGLKSIVPMEGSIFLMGANIGSVM